VLQVGCSTASGRGGRALLTVRASSIRATGAGGWARLPGAAFHRGSAGGAVAGRALALVFLGLGSLALALVPLLASAAAMPLAAAFVADRGALCRRTRLGRAPPAGGSAPGNALADELSISATDLPSAGATMVMAVPVLPARPVPANAVDVIVRVVRHVEIEDVVTSGMSRPRAATSEAISSATLPLRNESRAACARLVPSRRAVLRR